MALADAFVLRFLRGAQKLKHLGGKSTAFAGERELW
jgi:hypothetical protein